MNGQVARLGALGPEVFLPMPVFPVIEDVGWWQGADGSAYGQPYRNGFPRTHQLADYRALVRLAERLGLRLAVGMVVGEWDRENLLGRVVGASWMGRGWDNRANLGPWQEEAARLLHERADALELGVHGLCHEFWDEQGRMERAEFHDRYGRMRARDLIASHLAAFQAILRQYGFTERPRLFFPPALHHSFGNGRDSVQAILFDHGIRHVVTRFARARRFSPPRHELMTWECGVGLLERGLAPVSWQVAASRPEWDFSGPILPLHWGNLLHPDPMRNAEIVDGWAELLLEGTAGPERILATDFADCWSQAAACCFGRLITDRDSAVLDLAAIPQEIPGGGETVSVKVRGSRCQPLYCAGGRILADRADDRGQLRILRLRTDPGSRKLRLQAG